MINDTIRETVPHPHKYSVAVADHSLRDDSRVTRTETASISIDRSAEDLYYYWRELSNLPHFMKTLESVDEYGIGVSRWTRRLPSGAIVSWNAEITCDFPGSRIAWRSLPGSAISEVGAVRFLSASVEGATEVQVTIEYEAARSAAARSVANLFHADPGAELGRELKFLKRELERDFQSVSAISHWSQ